MKKWLRRIRGAVGMGLTWAVVWAVVAVLIGLLVDPDGSTDEMWPAIGAYPGFLGGVVFSVVLAVAARRRGLHELSLPRVAAWGAAAGLLVGVLPFTIGEPTTEVPLWLLATVVIGTITLLSSASAAGSLALARMAEKRALRDAGADVAGQPRPPLVLPGRSLLTGGSQDRPGLLGSGDGLAAAEMRDARRHAALAWRTAD